ncbi:hypothetical protein M3Y97_01019500 [Aphelenchoides bicaudatus]|nr:hypothetical protein M3Y97_01019500 [Aphelenchoides bicaudatus]
MANSWKPVNTDDDGDEISIKRQGLRCSVATKVIACLVLLFLLGAVVFGAIIFFPSKSYPQPIKSYSNDTHGIFGHQCQSLEIPLSGREIKNAHPSAFTFRGFVGIFSFGETYTDKIPKILNLVPNCTPQGVSAQQEFHEYVIRANSDRFKRFLTYDSAFNQFPLTPDPHRCEPGQLTATGALQLMRTGNYLYQLYAPRALFASLKKTEIFIASTVDPRTFQSVVAFASTFFYNVPNINIKRLHIVASNTTYFCFDEHCQCPKYEDLKQEAYSEHIEQFQAGSSPKVYDRIQTLGKMVGINQVDHPRHLMDALLGKYVCRREPVSCTPEGDCLGLDDYLQVSEESEKIENRLYATNSSSARSKAMIDAWEVLEHVANATAIARLEKKGRTVVKILSGHNFNIESVVHALMLNYTLPVPVASRLIFEIYEITLPVKKETLFFRILLNGKDVTRDFPFCAGVSISTFCAANRVVNYVKNDLFKLQNATSLEEMCN